MGRNKGGKEAVKDEIKQVPRNQVKRGVKDDSKPEATEEAKAEVTEGVNGSADGSNELPIEIASINQPSENLPVLFQAETETLPMPSQLKSLLDPQWKAPTNWGLDDWVQRADELFYWSDGIGRLDARLYKLAGESLWFIWDWFRKRRVEVKEQGLKLKDEPITWMGLHEKKRWDRATTGRKIRFYLKHRNTPDEELSGQSIISMWEPSVEHTKEPPRLGSCWVQSSGSREQLCDERGNPQSKQMDLKQDVIVEVVGFNDDRTQNCLMRIRTGIHAAKHFKIQGIALRNPVPLEKVPDLQKAIEDARPKKGKAKGKGKGGVPVTKPPEDAPVWALKDGAANSVLKVIPYNGKWRFENKKEELSIHERVKQVTEMKGQTICELAMPHGGFTWFRVETPLFTQRFTLEKPVKPEQPSHQEQPPLSEDFKEGFAQLVSFMEFLERFKPTLHEYTLMGKKLDEACSYFDEMREQVEKEEQLTSSD